MFSGYFENWNEWFGHWQWTDQILFSAFNGNNVPIYVLFNDKKFSDVFMVLTSSNIVKGYVEDHPYPRVLLIHPEPAVPNLYEIWHRLPVFWSIFLLRTLDSFHKNANCWNKAFNLRKERQNNHSIWMNSNF